MIIASTFASGCLSKSVALTPHKKIRRGNRALASNSHLDYAGLKLDLLSWTKTMLAGSH
jgi:hypothetical protein